MYNIGIDSGSRTTKICIFDVISKKILSLHIEKSLPNHEVQIESLIDSVLIKNNIDKSLISDIVLTGYGRKNYSAATKAISEIICHAQGVYFLNPSIRTIIDIGGQDSKVIKLSDKGKVLDFVMNDKCAAGTGLFLEKVSEYFGIKLEEMSRLSLQHSEDIEISSTCAVFAESEIIGLVSSNVSIENILNAVNKSVVHRVISMLGSVGIEYPIAFVGGVARNSGVYKSLCDYLKFDVYVPETPEYTGAIGAVM